MSPLYFHWALMLFIGLFISHHRARQKERTKETERWHGLQMTVIARNYLHAEEKKKTFNTPVGLFQLDSDNISDVSKPCDMLQLSHLRLVCLHLLTVLPKALARADSEPLRTQSYIYSKHQIYTSVKNKENWCRFFFFWGFGYQTLYWEPSKRSCVKREKPHKPRGVLRLWQHEFTTTTTTGKGSPVCHSETELFFDSFWKCQWPRRDSSGRTSFPQRIGVYRKENAHSYAAGLVCRVCRVCCKQLRSCFWAWRVGGKGVSSGCGKADEPWFNEQQEQRKQSRVYFPCWVLGMSVCHRDDCEEC